MRSGVCFCHKNVDKVRLLKHTLPRHPSSKDVGLSSAVAADDPIEPGGHHAKRQRGLPACLRDRACRDLVAGLSRLLLPATRLEKRACGRKRCNEPRSGNSIGVKKSDR